MQDTSNYSSQQLRGIRESLSGAIDELVFDKNGRVYFRKRKKKKK
jgi:hypothetical protein